MLSQRIFPPRWSAKKGMLGMSATLAEGDFSEPSASHRWAVRRCRSSPPKVLEPRGGKLGVADRVLDVLVAEVRLERLRVHQMVTFGGTMNPPGDFPL